ncbi:MAG: hypothetical protein MUC92_05965 [Fimbriimonadaceae bacterium]|nr:hypothetical protein [Fimbriimonadaceae bacterium]
MSTRILGRLALAGGGPGDQVGNLPPKVGSGRAWLRARAARVFSLLDIAPWVSFSAPVLRDSGAAYTPGIFEEEATSTTD